MVTCRRLELPAHTICDAAGLRESRGDYLRGTGAACCERGVDGPTWLAGRLDIEAQTVADRRRNAVGRCIAEADEAFRKGKP